MEIKVNEEIRNIKETFLLGLSLRQTICSILALLSGLGVYFLLKDSMELELSISLSMIAALPFACMGFITIQGMAFEKIIVELIKSYVINPLELYNKPINLFAAWKHEEEYNAPEAVKKRNQKKTKKIIITISFIVIFISAAIIASALGNNIAFNEFKETEYNSLLSHYDTSLYGSDQLIQLNDLINSCKEELSSVQSEKDLNVLLRTYKNKINAIPTYPELLSEALNNEYVKSEKNHPDLIKVIDSLSSEVKSADSIKKADNLYAEAKTLIQNEIKALSKGN